MKTRIQKWGNSLALRIPKALASDANMAAGSAVDVTLDKGRLVVESDTGPRFELGDLLAGVRRSNTHGETETGRPAGREIW